MKVIGIILAIILAILIVLPSWIIMAWASVMPQQNAYVEIISMLAYCITCMFAGHAVVNFFTWFRSRLK